MLFIECMSNWHGDRCQLRTCSKELCNNRGNCVSTSTSLGYRCDCLPGYSGTQCATATCSSTCFICK